MKKNIKYLQGKFVLSIFIILLFLLISCRSAERSAINSPEELLKKMTLSEKIGQMTQAERSDIRRSDISEFMLGSILSGGGSVPRTNTPFGWINMISGFTDESLKTRLGIPLIYGIDAVHGHNNVVNAVILPHNVALGAIAVGNLQKGEQAAYKAALITAQEMRATGVFWTFAPVLGIAEDIRWGRSYECYSENLDIVTALGTSVVIGLHEGGAAACIKHYIGEGQTTG